MAFLRLSITWAGHVAPLACAHVRILSFLRSLIQFSDAMTDVCSFGLLRGALFGMSCLRVAVCRYARMKFMAHFVCAHSRTQRE